MKNRKSESWAKAFELIEGLCFHLPLFLARRLISLRSGVMKHLIAKKVSPRTIQIGFILCLAFAAMLGLLLIYFAPKILFSRSLNTLEQVGMGIVTFYVGCVLTGLPLFTVFSGVRGAEDALFKSKRRIKIPDATQMRRNRLKSDAEKIYLGESFYQKRPVYLTRDQRLMHAEVVGSTGTGKTESVLLPMLAHDIASGSGAIVIDGKGDLELLNHIHYLVKAKNRLKDFYFFSLAHPGKSNTYNPLLRGSATELKDKIIGSMLWSEEFYRRMAEQATQVLLNVLVRSGRKITFSTLYHALTEKSGLRNLYELTGDIRFRQDIGRMLTEFKDNRKYLSGLMADLFLTSRSEFAQLLNVKNPKIDLLDVYNENKIVYFQLCLQGYGDTGKRLGRMIVQDIRTLSSHIQAHIPEYKRHFFPIFIDDASSFIDQSFMDFLNKARASKLAITLLHQSLGDLIIRRDAAFQQQIMENTNIKIILRQDDPQSVEKLTKVAGTRRTTIPTFQTQEKLFGRGFTGVGSIREGQTFRIEPDLIRALKRGEAVVILKSPAFYTDYVKLDFIGHNPYPGIFEPEPNPVDPPDDEAPASDHPLQRVMSCLGGNSQKAA